MICVICNKEIESGAYGSTAKGFVHKECYEKEHEGQRGKRPSWVILNNVSETPETTEPEITETALPKAEASTVVIRPKHAEGGQFFYFYEDKDFPKKEVSSKEIVEIATKYGFQAQGNPSNVSAVFYLRFLSQQQPNLGIKISLSTYK